VACVGWKTHRGRADRELGSEPPAPLSGSGYEHQGLRRALVDAAQDSAALVARREVCRALATGFEQLGDSLLVHGHLFGPQRVDGTSPTGNGDDRLVALGYLSKTAGALIRGALSLTLAGNCYASSALNRQLVEVEYLAWAFVEDQEEASNWLRSSNQQRLDRWQPRHLRQRSQGWFRGADYSNHCETGGHPTPDGMRPLLPGNPLVTELVVSEIATHGTSAWDYLRPGVVVLCLELQLEPTTAVPDTHAKAVGTAEGEWRTHERLNLTWQGRQSS